MKSAQPTAHRAEHNPTLNLSIKLGMALYNSSHSTGEAEAGESLKSPGLDWSRERDHASEDQRKTKSLHLNHTSRPDDHAKTQACLPVQ